MKVAICIRGAVAKISGSFFTVGSLYREGEYVNVQACANAIRRHIIRPNPDDTFDFFIHCWNPDLSEKLIAIYQPKLSSFEDNALYQKEMLGKSHFPNDFSGISHSLSIKKSIELAEQYQSDNGFTYDRFILVRPDVLLMKDIELKNYDSEKMYVNGSHLPNPRGDFHFVMNAKTAHKFKGLYHSIENGNPSRPHFWIQNYIRTYMEETLYENDIIAGIDEEVLRKIYCSVLAGKVSMSRLQEYGLTEQEILSYNKP